MVLQGESATIKYVASAFARHGLAEPSIGSQVNFGSSSREPYPLRVVLGRWQNTGGDTPDNEISPLSLNASAPMSRSP